MNEQNETVDVQDVRRSLNAALLSPQFAPSPQLSEFLRYIVERTLDGGEEELKAYSIAVDALGRDEDFDPQTNAAVRVAAGRLRRALDLYNASEEAKKHPVEITLQPGSYVPTFTQRSFAPESVKDKKPIVSPSGHQVIARPSRKRRVATRGRSIATMATVGALAVLGIVAAIFLWPSMSERFLRDSVDRNPVAAIPGPLDNHLRPRIRAIVKFPDESYPDWFSSGEIISALAVVLSRFDDFEFLGVREGPSAGSRHTRAADYLVTLTGFQRGKSVRIFAQLSRGRDGVALWSTARRFSKPDNIEERDIADIIGRAFAPLGSPYGVIYADLAQRTQVLRPELSCIISIYRYFSTESDERHLKARNCAEMHVEKGTILPSLHAGLAFIYLDEHREGRNQLDRDPVAAARRVSQRAIELAPLSARAHQAAFAVHKVQGHEEEAKAAASRARELNPYDIDILADYGAWLISVGSYDEGRELLEDAHRLLQATPAWQDFYRFIGAELAGDFVSADSISRMLDMKRSPLLAAAVAIGAHRRGETEKTRRALEELVRIEPSMATDPEGDFIRRGFREDVALRISDWLRQAGLRPPTN